MLKRQVLLSLGCLFLLFGWLCAFLLRTLSPIHDYYYLVPTLFLECGMGILLKLTGRRVTALTLGLTGIAAVVGLNQLYPEQKISFANFQSRLLQQAKVGRTLTVEAPSAIRTGELASAHELQAFADLSIRLYARLPGEVGMLTFAPDGAAYVSLPQLGAIYRLRDDDRDGFAEQVLLFHHGLDRPYGLAWNAGQLFVAEPTRLLTLEDDNRDGEADALREILTDLPDDGGHWRRALAVGGEGRLYLAVGSRCNACEEPDPLRATVLEVEPETGQAEVFARGLRNIGGLAVNPAVGELWSSENSRFSTDGVSPPDEINHLVAGGDYGWPHCDGQQLSGSELETAGRCQQTLPAVVELPAGSTPLGLTFGAELSAPEKYRNSLYLVLQGPREAGAQTVGKLVRYPLVAGTPTAPGKEFLAGWNDQGRVWGRPVAPAVGPDGQLYLTVARANAVYQIRWNALE